MAVKAAPRPLTTAIMISTAATPPRAFTIGNTKMPSVAPNLAAAAAKPPAEARMPVGNNSSANANVVALGPAFYSQIEQNEPDEHERNVCGRANSGQLRDQQNQHADCHADKSDDLHIDPPKARHRPKYEKKCNEEKNIDRGGAFSVGKFRRQRSSRV